jgi:ABC-type lipoprotein export system ATPase subunit
LKEIWTNRKRSRVEQLRRECVGFALQSGELLSSLTVAENIAVPLRLNGAKKTKVNQRVEELLLAFKLKTRNTDTNGTADFNRSLASQRINRLSGGEYQRVALARAIVHQPTLLFVDEPTSALNRELAYGALNELRSLQCNEEARGAVIMITHDEELAAMFADTIIRMAPRRGTAIGEVVSIEANVPRLPELILADPVAGSFT